MLKIKVANVVEEGKFAGPQARMTVVAQALSDRVDTLIVMPKTDSAQFQKVCSKLGVCYQTLPLTRITKDWTHAVRYVAAFPIEIFILSRLFRRARVDLVHASGGSWQYKAVIAAFLARKPVVWHLNDTLMPFWIKLIFLFVQRLATGFIFASKRSEEY